MRAIAKDGRVILSFAPELPPRPMVDDAVADPVVGRTVGMPVLMAPLPSPPAHHSFAIGSMTDDEVLAEIDRLRTHHEKKGVRSEAFRALRGALLTADGEAFTVTDIIIRDRGTDVELHLCAIDGDGEVAAGMPFSVVYPAVDEIPSNEDVAAAMIARLADAQTQRQDQAKREAHLNALLNK
jgi:hypothetical protein